MHAVSGDLFRAVWPHYRRQGLAVIPANQDKEPHVSGFNKFPGPPSAKLLDGWAQKWPCANIAILCGLSRLIVVDIDDPDLTRSMWRRFGPTPLVAISPSGGRHLYYRGRCRTTNLRGEDLAVDIKSDGGYVLAPPSRRPDGTYEFFTGSIDDFARLPTIRWNGLPKLRAREGVEKGFRNETLFRDLTRFARDFADKQALLKEARRINATYDPPDDDRIVRKTVDSVWQFRLDHPRGAYKHNHVLINSSAAELPGDALKLLIRLRGAHDNDSRRGHDGFAFSPAAMWRANVMPGWSTKAYASARDALIDAGWLVEIKAPRLHHTGQYRFAVDGPQRGLDAPAAGPEATSAARRG